MRIFIYCEPRSNATFVIFSFIQLFDVTIHYLLLTHHRIRYMVVFNTFILFPFLNLHFIFSGNAFLYTNVHASKVFIIIFRSYSPFSETVNFILCLQKLHLNVVLCVLIFLLFGKWIQFWRPSNQCWLILFVLYSDVKGDSEKFTIEIRIFCENTHIHPHPHIQYGCDEEKVKIFFNINAYQKQQQINDVPNKIERNPWR